MKLEPWQQRELVDQMAEVLGERPVSLVRTDRGESGSTWFVSSRTAETVLKVAEDIEEALANQERLVRMVEGLRSRGYPSPEYLGVGRAGGVVFSLQRRIDGQSLEPAPGQAPDAHLFQAVLPELLVAIELQAEAGDLPDPPWPGWLLSTILEGGNGYCLLHTMRARPDTASLLERLQSLAKRACSESVACQDIVHFDMNTANILHRDGRLAGIIDWNVPFPGAGQGDRGFDLATVLFYSYDLPATREALWEAAVALSGIAWTSVYLSHLCLRQVEWSVRHRPGSSEERRFMDIANAVLDRCSAEFA